MEKMILENKIIVKQNAFIPHGDGMLAVKNVHAKGFIPTHARFRAKAYWANSGIASAFPTWEIDKKISEREALQELKKRICGDKRFSNVSIYLNLGNDLRTYKENKTFDFEESAWSDKKEIRNQEIIWTNMGQVDIHAMRIKYNQPLK